MVSDAAILHHVIALVPVLAFAVMLPGERVRVEPEGVFARAADGAWRKVATSAGMGERKVTPAGGNWVRVESRGARCDRYRFTGRAEWSYSPSVGGFNPDAQYKTPVILVQEGRRAFAIVADVAVLDRTTLKRSNHALDLDVQGGPVLSVGFMAARRLFHAVYREDPDKPGDAALVNCYYLFASADAAPGAAYREAVRFVWERFGRRAQANAAWQQAGTGARYQGLRTWAMWRQKIWDEESPREWLTVTMPDGSTGGAVRMVRLGAPQPSLYFGAWFNSMRTAVGMALYARREQRTELMGLARQTLQAALAAPGEGGAFRCIAIASDNGVEWAAGDGAGDSTRRGYLGFDMAWTGYWMLRWRAAGLPDGDRVLPRAEALARFFLARQAGDGFIPTRFDDGGRVEEARSRMVMAETAAVARFLFELYGQTRQAAYLEAGRRVLGFLERAVIPGRKWYDFETFWSCSPRLVAFDERSGQWPANNLALIHAVAAYQGAFAATGERVMLERGEALLDYLLLYQQVWTNPMLEDLSCPEMLLGGFTTQNSDAEWSDARQSLAGDVLMDYYRATGKAEYLERGVAALRAQFPVSPSENWAHVGYGKKAGVSGFHWGSGSGMAGIEFQEEFLRDAAFDVKAGRGVGVNGIDVTDFRVDGQRLVVRVRSAAPTQLGHVMTFHNVPPGNYQLEVNGVPFPSLSAEQLRKGVVGSGFGY